MRRRRPQAVCLAGNLDQGEGVAGGEVEDAASHLLVQRLRRRTAKQVGGRGGIQGAQRELLQPRLAQGGWLLVPHRHQQGDGIGEQAAGGESDGFGGRSVEPMGIVHQHQEWRLRPGGQRDPGWRRRSEGGPPRPAFEAEGSAQRRRRRGGDTVEKAKSWAEQLVEAGEGNVSLELDPSGASTLIPRPV